ncbi:MAG: hypothetical protein WD009_00950 [Phycisphaeraceae bacterium]
MATIGTLALNVVARTSNFEKGMRRSNRITRDFGSNVGGITRRVLGFASAVGVLAGGAGIGIMTRNSFAAIDATAKLSDRIGIATEELIGFRHAATLAGASGQTFDSAVQRMVRRLGKVRQGGGEAARALQQLGLRVDDLTAAGPAEAIRMIGDRMATLETQTDRVAAASRIFGNEGEALVNMLAQGREGMEAAQREAEKLGMTFSRIDAAKVEMANDAITRMRGAVRGVVQTLAIHLAPWIEAIASRFTEMSTSGVISSDSITSAIEWVVKSVASLSNHLKLGEAAFYKLRGVAMLVISKIGDGIVTLSNKATDAVENIISLVREVESFLPDSFGRAIDGVERGIKRMRSFNNQLDTTFADMASSAERSFERADKAIDSWVRGDNERAVNRFFENLKASAAEAAAAIAANAGNRLEVFGGEGASGGGFRQIVRSRAAVGEGGRGGRARTQEVKVGGEALNVLRQIRDATTRGVPGLMS